jgi:hypothetical protein
VCSRGSMCVRAQASRVDGKRLPSTRVGQAGEQAGRHTAQAHRLAAVRQSGRQVGGQAGIRAGYPPGPRWRGLCASCPR